MIHLFFGFSRSTRPPPATKRIWPLPADPPCNWPDGNPMWSSSVDLAARHVTRHDVQVSPTASQWHPLEIVARNRGRLVPQSRQLDEVRGPGHIHKAHYLRIFMAQIGEKLEPDPSCPAYFLTDSELDYRLSA